MVKKTTKQAAKKADGAKKAEDGEAAVLAAIAKMPGQYRAIGTKLHSLIKANAPGLAPRLWYGLPAYAKEGKVVCYMRMNPKPPFHDRYVTFGFNETARLDDGAMWPTAYAVTKLTAAEEAKVAALVKEAVG
jgi:uncharacterized protein YdhG (YjbR/CyaY superfamily)